ncbi:MAG: hypothetical protein AAF242_05890 [Bacteroidota bacterium]
MSKFTFLLVLVPLLYQPKSTTATENQDVYTYRLTITSLSEQEEIFDLTIKSAATLDDEPEVQEWKDLKTPYVEDLPTGVHTVIVTAADKGIVMSKLNGVVDGEEKGFVSSSKKKATLNAGPGGQYHSGYPNW